MILLSSLTLIATWETAGWLGQEIAVNQLSLSAMISPGNMSPEESSEAPPSPPPHETTSPAG